jgi:hypothetical protein
LTWSPRTHERELGPVSKPGLPSIPDRERRKGTSPKLAKCENDALPPAAPKVSAGEPHGPRRRLARRAIYRPTLHGPERLPATTFGLLAPAHAPPRGLSPPADADSSRAPSALTFVKACPVIVFSSVGPLEPARLRLSCKFPVNVRDENSEVPCRLRTTK